MYTFITSDAHFGHHNIIQYCGRPFVDTHEMNMEIIRRWNERVKPDDIVYHVGDFCFKGGHQGGMPKAQYFESQLNGTIIHIKGNHDKNNTTRSVMQAAFFEFSNKVIYVTHIPPIEQIQDIEKLQLYKKLKEQGKKVFPPTFMPPDFCDLILCGHVHEKWKYKWNANPHIPIINVGLDVWNFYPIRMDEVIAFYDTIIRTT